MSATGAIWMSHVTHMKDLNTQTQHPNLTNPSSHFGVLSQFEFVSRDTKKSEFLDFMDFGDASFAVPTNHYGVARVSRID